jgi:hypothetical protein
MYSRGKCLPIGLMASYLALHKRQGQSEMTRELRMWTDQINLRDETGRGVLTPDQVFSAGSQPDPFTYKQMDEYLYRTHEFCKKEFGTIRTVL